MNNFHFKVAINERISQNLRPTNKVITTNLLIRAEINHELVNQVELKIMQVFVRTKQVIEEALSTKRLG